MESTSESGISHHLNLTHLPIRLAVCILPPDSATPAWAESASFHSITRTDDELSIVCNLDNVPHDVEKVGPWECLKVEGPLDFSLTGVLASLAMPLAQSGISVYAVSTFRTDYLLVPEHDLHAAASTLRKAGHTVTL